MPENHDELKWGPDFGALPETHNQHSIAKLLLVLNERLGRPERGNGRVIAKQTASGHWSLVTLDNTRPHQLHEFGFFMCNLHDLRARLQGMTTAIQVSRREFRTHWQESQAQVYGV